MNLKKRITRICKNCGKPFEINKYRLKQGGRIGIYCSVQCVADYHSKTHRETRICKACGQPFSVVKSSKRKYCSDECTKKRVWVKKIRVPRICARCGKEFIPKQFGKFRKGIYCSRECFFNDHTRYKVTPPETRYCKKCGKEFLYPVTAIDRAVHAKGGGGLYCSVDCYWDRNGNACTSILKKHHDDLKHDPERLTTKFIADVAGCACKIIKEKIG